VKTLRERRNEGGFSLPELMIYVLLLSIVMIIIGSMLISSLRTERTVDRVVAASTSAQLAIKSIEYGVRNASAHRIFNLTNTDQLLRARVAKPDQEDLDYSCRAWYFDRAKSELRYKESDAKILDPSTAELAEWTLLAHNVTPTSAPNVFGDGATLELTVGFRVATGGDDPPAEIKTSVVRRVSSSESAPCY
jgi:type II secretory pathway component PulJ